MKTNPDILKVLTDLSIPIALHKRLSPFIRIISNQQIRKDVQSLLVILESIEQMYYSVDIVVNFQKFIANTNTITNSNGNLSPEDQVGFTKKDIKKLKTIIKLFDQSISSFKVLLICYFFYLY